MLDTISPVLMCIQVVKVLITFENTGFRLGDDSTTKTKFQHDTPV